MSKFTDQPLEDVVTPPSTQLEEQAPKKRSRKPKPKHEDTEVIQTVTVSSDLTPTKKNTEVPILQQPSRPTPS